MVSTLASRTVVAMSPTRCLCVLVFCLALACSAPDYYEVTPFASRGQLVSRGGNLDSDESGLMLTVGWNLQAERHHREQQLELARGGAGATVVVDHHEDAPVEDSGSGAFGGMSNTAIGGGIAALLGALAVLVKSMVRKKVLPEEVSDD